MGLDADIGSIEVGKKADLAVIRLGGRHTSPGAPPKMFSSIVYAAEASDVRSVVVDGRILMNERTLLTLDESEVINRAEVETERLLERAGLK